MNRILANELLPLLSSLKLFADGARGSKSTPLDDGVRKHYLMVLDGLSFQCEKMELVKTVGAIEQFKQQITCSPPLNSSDVARAHLQAVLSSFSKEVNDRHFEFIPQAKALYRERDDLFGGDVSRNFKSAIPHIKSAGNCLAADLHTAGVFHLMCVAELGLRALARKLGVRTIKKSTPLELGTWEDVIKALELKVNGNFPRTKKGQQESDFYKGVFIEYRAFKDFWRNKVMHTRIDYDEHSAMSAFEHVRSFMQRLSERVSEVN